MHNFSVQFTNGRFQSFSSSPLVIADDKDCFSGDYYPDTPITAIKGSVTLEGVPRPICHRPAPNNPSLCVKTSGQFGWEGPRPQRAVQRSDGSENESAERRANGTVRLSVDRKWAQMGINGRMVPLGVLDADQVFSNPSRRRCRPSGLCSGQWSARHQQMEALSPSVSARQRAYVNYDCPLPSVAPPPAFVPPWQGN